MASSIWAAAGEAEKYRLVRPDHPQGISDNVVTFLREKYSAPLVQAIDVGCGSGLSSCKLVSHFDRVTGVDPSLAMVEEARKSFPLAGLQFQTGGAEDLPQANNSAQLVIAGRAIHYFKQADFFKEVDRVLVPGGVVAYYSVHFPTVLDEQVDKLWWEVMDSEQLAPFWPTNPGDGHTIGARNRRDYYVNVIKAPYPEKRVDETVSYDREVTLASLAKELDTYSAAVRQREARGNEVADKMIADFLEKSLKALGTSDKDTPIKTRNSFFVVMARKPL